MNVLLLTIGLSLVFGIILAKTLPLKRYTVDLDQPPETRWDPVMKDFRRYLRIIIPFMIRDLVPDGYSQLAEIAGERIDHFYPAEYAAEIRGIARTTGIPLNDVLVYNLMYDVTVFCTGVLAQDTQGRIYHGRNMDWGENNLENDIVRNVTALVDFNRNGQLLYTSIHHVGFVGIHTALKPYTFSIQLNQRDIGNFTAKNIIMILLGALPAQIAIRQALETKEDFQSAVQYLSTVEQISPDYIIIGGAKAGEGAIITRDRVEALDVSHWYLVQSNDDPWIEPPHDERRNITMKSMKNLTQQGVNANTIFDALFKPKVLSYRTIFTCVMSAADPSSFHAVIQRRPRISSDDYS